MTRRVLLIIVIVLLSAHPSVAEDTGENTFGISLDKEPLTISLRRLEQAKLKVEVKKKTGSETVKDGIMVSAECDKNCAELVTVANTSIPTRDGYAIFTITAKDKVGSQIVSFSADGVKTVPVRIEIYKPKYILIPKVTDQGKALELKVGEDNKIDIDVKEGNASVPDGLEVQAIIGKDGQKLFEEPLSLKVMTRNGIATFNFKARDVNADATIRFQVNDSFTELKVNISRLSFYQDIVEKTVRQLLGYMAILAAIGTVSMGLLEALKWNDFIKGKTQGRFLKGYLQNGQKKDKAKTEAIAKNIIEATYGGYDDLREKVFYRQSAEDIIKEAKDAFEKVISGKEIRPALKDFIDTACPENESAPDAAQEQQRRMKDSSAYLNAVLIDMNARWKFWNQIAATVLSVVIIGGALYYFRRSDQCVKIFALSFFGGLLAPLVKDFTTTASSTVSRLKS